MRDKSDGDVNHGLQAAVLQRLKYEDHCVRGGRWRTDVALEAGRKWGVNNSVAMVPMRMMRMIPSTNTAQIRFFLRHSSFVDGRDYCHP